MGSQDLERLVDFDAQLRGQTTRIQTVQLLALDFDGVISDSAEEAFLVAVRTYRELHSRCGLPELARASEARDLYLGFVELMPLGNRAEDFAVALSALDAGQRLENQEQYDLYFATQAPESLRRFHQRFYEQRHAWSERDPEGWLSLMAPYPEFVDLLRRRSEDVTLAIATAKDRDSVERLLVRYGLADLFPAEFLMDKEAGRDKGAHLQALRARAGVPPDEITFVDDKLNHLESVRGLGVRTALAGWGYNGRREREAAERTGHQVLTLEAAEGMLFGAP